MSKIHILFENDEWTAPLVAELENLDLPYHLWDLSMGHFDLSATPPEGVYYSRMSASAHSRIIATLRNSQMASFNGLKVMAAGSSTAATRLSSR